MTTQNAKSALLDGELVSEPLQVRIRFPSAHFTPRTTSINGLGLDGDGKTFDFLFVNVQSIPRSPFIEAPLVNCWSRRCSLCARQPWNGVRERRQTDGSRRPLKRAPL